MSSKVAKIDTVEVRFGDFEGIPARKGVDKVESPEFTCFGHQWCLRLFPGGERESNDGKVSLYLCHNSDGNIKVKVDLFTKVPVGVVGTAASASLREHDFHDGRNSWGTHDFAERSFIISNLQYGDLVIQVQMKQSKPAFPAYLENPLSKMIVKRFMDEESADVTFEVGCVQVKDSGKKKTKTESTMFHAHRFILQDSAPYLYNLSTSITELTTVQISDVKPEIFRHMLYYAYGGKVPEEDLKANAMDVITAADKYEVVGLKLEAEAVLVSSTTITLDNVMELLLYADEKNCALLKEAAMDFLVKNKSEVASKVSFGDLVPGRLMNDLLVAMNMDNSMRVNTLREKLHAKGLEIDGSREAMIALLEENP